MLRVHGVYLLESEEFPISVMVSPASFLVFLKGTSDVQSGYGCGNRREDRRPALAAGCHRPHHQAREGQAQGQGQARQGQGQAEGRGQAEGEEGRNRRPARVFQRAQGQPPLSVPSRNGRDQRLPRSQGCWVGRLIG